MCLLFALASEPPLALWLRWTGGGGPRCCCATLSVAALCVSEQRVPSGDDRRNARVCCIVRLLPSVDGNERAALVGLGGVRDGGDYVCCCGGGSLARLLGGICGVVRVPK